MDLVGHGQMQVGRGRNIPGILQVLIRLLARFKFPNKFHYEPWLVVDGADASPSGKRIFITESYGDVFHRLLRLRESDVDGDAKGAVLVGQPGIGGYDQVCVPCSDPPADLFSENLPSYSSCSHGCSQFTKSRSYVTPPTPTFSTVASVSSICEAWLLGYS